MQLTRCNILLIEDNPGDARLVHENLREAGDTLFHVEHVDRLARGLERLSLPGIDLVLLDLSLPDTSGMETFNRLHAHAPHIPVIVMSGLDDEELALGAVQSGAQDYLIKGQVTGAFLVRSMRYGLERWRLIEEAHAAQAEIEALNKRLRRTVTESHHRIKNSLQVLAALVEIQLIKGMETLPSSELSRISQHIRGLGAVHDLLTQEAKSCDESNDLSVSAALHKMLPMLQVLAGERKIVTDVTDIVLTMQQSTSVVILVNELISNAIKHGTGAIELILRRDGEYVVLEVRDDGAGFPEAFNPQIAANTGLELIDSLSRWDLGGQVAYDNHPAGGAQVRIRFPQHLRKIVGS